MRTSAHQLGIERGRHGKLTLSYHHRACKFCSAEDENTLIGLLALPFCDLIIEDELHMLCALALSTMLIVTRIPSKQRLFVDDPRYSIVVTFEGSLSTLGTFSASDF